MFRSASTETDLVEIDFPGPRETIVSTHYAIRVKASKASQVDVSIDGGLWQPCRFSVGYWWFDWSNIGAGAHEIRARARRNPGGCFESAPRRVVAKQDALFGGKP